MRTGSRRRCRPIRTPTGFQPDLVRDFLEGDGADCAYVLFGLAGTLLTQNALRRIGHAFSVFDDAQAVYGDLDIRSDDGSLWPLALSAFDYERMLEQGYCAHLFAATLIRRDAGLGDGSIATFIGCSIQFSRTRTSPATALFTFRAVSAFCRCSIARRQAKRLRLPASRIFKPEALRPKPQRLSADIFPTVHIVRVAEPQSVTIVIPTRDRQALLEACIESIRPALKRGKIEIMVVDNDSAESDAREYLAKIGSRLATVVSGARGLSILPGSTIARQTPRTPICFVSSTTTSKPSMTTGSRRC